MLWGILEAEIFISELYESEINALQKRLIRQCHEDQPEARALIVPLAVDLETVTPKGELGFFSML